MPIQKLRELVEKWRKEAHRETAKNGTTYVDYVYCADELEAAIPAIEAALKANARLEVAAALREAPHAYACPATLVYDSMNKKPVTPGECNCWKSHISADRTALDAYVRERVAEARIEESERGHQELHGCKPFRHADNVVYCKWCAYHAELEAAAHRAKVAGSK